MIQLKLSTAAQVALCTNCPLPECREGSDRCPLVIEQRRRWRLQDRSKYWAERHNAHYVPVEHDRRGGRRKGSGRPKVSYTEGRTRNNARDNNRSNGDE